MFKKLTKMETKNDWYLVSVEKSDFKNIGNFYYIATYSNGLLEQQKFYAIDDQIKTIMDNSYFVI